MEMLIARHCGIDDSHVAEGQPDLPVFEHGTMPDSI